MASSSVGTKWDIQAIQGGVTAARGFQAAGIHTGVKRQKKDLSLLVSQSVCTAAGTFTTNKVKAAPLAVTKEHLRSGRVRAVVVNSGNANACNGPQGLIDARRMAYAAARSLGFRLEEVLVGSTGVIGEPLPIDKIEKGIARAARSLSPEGGTDAAVGIMTTDTRPKEAAFVCRSEGMTFRIGGMAKGSGMIHPNMATMLGFITTDASVEKDLLEVSLKEAVDKSFNLITVDGDTSTNDMVLALANGSEEHAQIRAGTEEADLFCWSLTEVCTRLAKMIAADGEGATKLVEVRVQGARSEAEARQAVRAIARSPLVKTAVYGEDPNWGRILCATGYSGAEFDPDQAGVLLGEIKVFERGQGVPFDESLARKALAGKEVVITVDLGAGEAFATGWTCDLTYDYVKINASYRT